MFAIWLFALRVFFGVSSSDMFCCGVLVAGVRFYVWIWFLGTLLFALPIAGFCFYAFCSVYILSLLRLFYLILLLCVAAIWVGWVFWVCFDGCVFGWWLGYDFRV